MKTKQEELMQFCWMRNLDYSHIIRFASAFQLNLVQLPSPDTYKDYCTKEEKGMENHFRLNLKDSAFEFEDNSFEFGNNA